MHQRHPIRVEKSRALPAGNDRQITGSTQLSFHKIYRQKRCYSNLDKGKQGFSSSQWKSDCGNTSRESNFVSEPRYSTGHDGVRTTRRTDYKEIIKSVSPSSLSISTGSVKGDREFPKRSFDRFSCNFTSGCEFDAPLVKKQKVEHCRSSAPQHYPTPDFEHSKQKFSLDETKWMYKNQHAKMSGPYGVKQLMEGLQSRFLQEDLPIYQLYEGKLGKPITLKQLMDDMNQSMRESRRMHSNQNMPCQPFLQVSAEEEVVSDDDFPPGFGGRSSQFSQNTSSEVSPNYVSTVPGSKFPVHGFSSSMSDFGDNDLGLPPGFEGGAVIDSQTTEFCGTPQNVPSTAGVAARSGGVRLMRSGYEQLEPTVHDRAYAGWQGSSPAYSNQGTNTGSELSSSGHTAWAYVPAATMAPSFEPLTLSQPTVCIGLPVSKPATCSWPIASNLTSGVYNAEPYGYPNAATLTIKKESTGFLERQSPDPLSLILSELLAAVKRTYVSNVLSALIGEQLDCWLDANKHWIGRGLCFDNKGSPARGAGRILSRTEDGLCGVEFRASHSVSVEANTSQVEASTATTNCPNVCPEATDAQGSEGSWSVDYAASFQGLQLFPTDTINDVNPNGVNPYTLELADTLPLSNADKNVLGASKMSPSGGKADNFFLGPDKVESPMPKEEVCLSKLSSSIGNKTSQPFSLAEEEMQHKSDANCRFQSSGNNVTSDAVQLEAMPPLRAKRHKKENMKSLKQLMAITSKLRSARLKSGASKKSESKLSCSNIPEVLEIRPRHWILASEHYDGCARTSVCVSWKSKAQGDGCKVECCQTTEQSFTSGVSCMQRVAHSARPCNTALGSLAADAEDFHSIKLMLSKLLNKGRLNVARSKIHKWGVFSAEAVEADEFVIEYLGELVRSRIAEFREEHYARLGIGSGYLFHIDNESAVDATKRGGLARFINHSCDPNCYIKIVAVDGSKRVLVFAKRHIQAGEEVTYDYKSVHGVLNFQCSCGSSKCGDWEEYKGK